MLGANCFFQSLYSFCTLLLFFSFWRRLKTTRISSSSLKSTLARSGTILSVTEHCTFAQLPRALEFPAVTSHDSRKLSATELFFFCYTCRYRSQNQWMKGKRTTFIHSVVLLRIMGPVTFQSHDAEVHRWQYVFPKGFLHGFGIEQAEIAGTPGKATA